MIISQLKTSASISINIEQSKYHLSSITEYYNYSCVKVMVCFSFCIQVEEYIPQKLNYSLC